MIYRFRNVLTVIRSELRSFSILKTFNTFKFKTDGRLLFRTPLCSVQTNTDRGLLKLNGFIRPSRRFSGYGDSQEFSRKSKPKDMDRRESTETEIFKSPNDKRQYRRIELENGLSVVLISDLKDGEEEADEDVEMTGEDSELEMSDDESDDEMDSEDDDDDDDIDNSGSKMPEGEKKSAAALCIGTGSFCDPEDIPGFAHFLEHMVFMGSEKYPKENELDDFLGRHGGFSNAWTDCERSCFYFEVEQKYFHKSLDMFANFFISPLLRQDSVDREIKAVDSEFQMTIPSDDDRLNMILGTTCKPGHPMSKFFCGNMETLKTTPQKNGTNIYDSLRDFYRKMYSAHYMTLAVQSKVSLDKLETWIREIFDKVPNNQISKPDFQHMKDPFDTQEFRKFFRVVPVNDGHTLHLIWAHPPQFSNYRTKPLQYLEDLLGHEGEGSLLSVLRKRHLATALVCGHSYDGFEMNSTWTMFEVRVTLTNEGLDHYQDVLLTLFQYIKMLQIEGPQKMYFDESKIVADTQIRWKEQGDPLDYVEKVSENMQMFSPQHILDGRKIFLDYDEELISKHIIHLQPDNCNIMLVSKKLENDCDMEEKWYKTKYGVQDIDPEWIKLWKDPPVNPSLKLPAPNNFISTDFTIKDVTDDQLSKNPRQIFEDEYCKLWYKKDTKFCIPKGFVSVHLMSSVVSQSLESATMFDLFDEILHYNVAECAYPAVLAGYSYSIGSQDTGIILKINGFNHKLPELFDTILEKMFNFTCSEELLHTMKEKVKKDYYNNMLKPSYLTRQLRFSVIDPNFQSTPEKYKVVDTLTTEMLRTAVNNFLQKIKADILVIGNFTPEEALWYKERLSSRLTGRAVSDSELFQYRLFEVPTFWHYCQLDSYNKDDHNSCVATYLQSRPGDIRSCVLNELLNTRMSEPCFDILRTQLQLGYSVGSQNLLTSGILGLIIRVEFQAHKFSMKQIDEHIENFLNRFKEILDKTTEEEFENLVKSMIASKSCEDTCLEEEVTRSWDEFTERTYIFDRIQKEIDVLRSLKLSDLQDWFQQYLGKQQRRISFQVLGKAGESKAENQSDIKPNTVTIPAGISADGDGPITAVDHSSVYKCRHDSNYDNSQKISDIQKFRSMLQKHRFNTVTH